MSELIKSDGSPPAVGMNLLEQCKVVAGTAIVPEYLRGKPDWVLALALKGRELGMGLMTSLDSLNYIKGKVSISAQGMVAIAKKRVKGADVVVVESTEDTCTIIARREGCEDFKVTKTRAEMDSRGLTANPTWKKYPENMLRWRAITDACRIQFADVLTGIYTPDELEANVDEQGEVVTAAQFTEVDYKGKCKAIHDKLLDSGIDHKTVGGCMTLLVDHYDMDYSKVHASLINGLRKHMVPEYKGHHADILVKWTHMIVRLETLEQFEEFIGGLETSPGTTEEEV
ncbi:MAG TPA: hypothetical protein VNA25_04995 [Phycisphaerae bacterium]|nr:hypothetical protein [Phycisphaerae bacterium]